MPSVVELTMNRYEGVTSLHACVVHTAWRCSQQFVISKVSIPDSLLVEASLRGNCNA